MTKQKILLVDDDKELSDMVSQFLVANGFDTVQIYRGDEAIEAINNEQPDLVVLDLMLPEIDGLSICRQVRDTYKGSIVMLTALDEDIDEVTGLEVGADDYLCKPIKPRVLLAHIRAQLRRQTIDATPKPNTKLTVNNGALSIDSVARSVSCNQLEVVLTSAEFDLLWLLASEAGKIISRDELHKRIFKLEFDGMDRSIDLRVSRLRKKLQDDPKEPQIIKTVRNKGYLLAE